EMRLDTRGLLAHERSTWRPAVLRAVGLALPSAFGSSLAATAGARARAAANAAGITRAAVLLLAGLRRGVAPVPLRAVAGDVLRLALAAAGACAAGLGAAAALGPGTPLLAHLAAGGAVTAAAFAVLTVLAGPAPVATWTT